MAYLSIHSDSQQAGRHTLNGPAVLGRALGCELWLEDRRLSRQHCRFEPHGDGWAVIDLNSTNGTSVNGARVSFHKLFDGDELRIGKTRVVYHTAPLPRDRPATPAPPAAENPGDTLIDSAVGIDRPAQSHQAKAPRPAAAARKRGDVPLAFTRPPARPQVGEALAKDGFLTRLRKLLGWRGGVDE